MKIKIDELGYLYLNGKTGICPFNSPKQCGDWCSLFETKWNNKNIDLQNCRHFPIDISFNSIDFEDLRK
jgi:hypothetical protein